MLRVRLFGRVGDDGPSMDCGPVDAVVYPGVDGGPLLLLAGDLVRGGGVGSAYDGGVHGASSICTSVLFGNCCVGNGCD